MPGTRHLLTALTFAAASAGCFGDGDPEVEVILTVLDSATASIPRDISVCVSTRFFSSADSTLPEELMNRLHPDGWHLYDPLAGADSMHRPAFPPDTGAAVVLFDWPRKEGEEWVVVAGVTETDLRGALVSWAVYDWTYRVSCDADSCRVRDVRSGGHGDGGPIQAEEFFRRDRPKCGEPRQGSAGQRRDGSPDFSAGTVR